MNAHHSPAGAVALLESRWPRHGLGLSDVVHGRCLARFASCGGDWLSVDDSGEAAQHGQCDPLMQLDRILMEAGRHHPAAGAIGYIAYEAGYEWVGLSPAKLSSGVIEMPEIQFLIFDNIHHAAKEFGSKCAASRKSVYEPDTLQRLADSAGIRRLTERANYIDAIREIQDHIAEGDIYQANYTQAFDLHTERAGMDIYEDLAASNPAPFAAYLRFPPLRWDAGSGDIWDFPELEIISNSPERFWKKSGCVVETRPIKGTIARGETVQSDRENRRRLLLSPKDRAELLMITDLERNDLGQFAETGSVKVQALRRTRACPSIWHLESLVTARVASSLRWPAIMRSMFPGGSITGAPKRRAMEILRDLEPVPRGVYCGAIGWVTAAGDADFSIAIRTAIKVGRNVRVHGGGGIVADSDPLTEYHESLIKIAPILECLCR